MRALPGMRVADHLVLGGEELRATNSAAEPDRVVPRPGRNSTVDGDVLTVPLPPVSWTVLRLAPSR